jgi:hypothetical protein
MWRSGPVPEPPAKGAALAGAPALSPPPARRRDPAPRSEAGAPRPPVRRPRRDVRSGGPGKGSNSSRPRSPRRARPASRSRAPAQGRGRAPQTRRGPASRSPGGLRRCRRARASRRPAPPPNPRGPVMEGPGRVGERSGAPGARWHDRVLARGLHPARAPPADPGPELADRGRPGADEAARPGGPHRPARAAGAPSPAPAAPPSRTCRAG